MASKYDSVKVNVGLFLFNDGYFEFIRDIIRRRDATRIKKFISNNKDKLYCPTCGGYGVLNDNKKIDLNELSEKAIIIPTVNEISALIRSLGETPLKIGRRLQILQTILRKEQSRLRQTKEHMLKLGLDGLPIFNTKESYLIDLPGDVAKLKLKKCPDCYGRGVNAVDHDPPLSATTYAVVAETAISLIKKGQAKGATVDLYSHTINVGTILKKVVSKSKLRFLTAKENSEKAIQDKRALDNLKASFRSANKEYDKPLPEKEKSKILGIAENLSKTSLDKIFNAFISQGYVKTSGKTIDIGEELGIDLVRTLKKTVRIDTKATYHKLKHRVRKTETNLTIYITGALMAHNPKSKNRKNFRDFQYINLYSDFSGVDKKPWSPKRGIKSVRTLLETKVKDDFVKYYELEKLFPSLDSMTITKKLLKRVVLFGEKYGG